MPIRVFPTSTRLESLTVLEHTLEFNGEDGAADGSELSNDEMARLRRFHFRIEETPDPKPEPPQEEIPQEAPLDIPVEPVSETVETPAASVVPKTSKPAPKPQTRGKR